MANYTLDIKRPGSQFTVEGLHVGDNSLRVFNFHFCEGQNDFQIPKDCIATLYARLPDKANTTVYAPCHIEGNAVVFSLSGAPEGAASLTSYAGKVDAEIRLTTANGGILTSPKFSLLVEDTLQDDGAIEAVSDFSALTRALAKVLEAENGLSSKIDRIEGKNGNIVILGTDGAVADGNMSISDILKSINKSRNYLLIYDETGNFDNENLETVNSYKEDLLSGNSPSLTVKYSNTCHPAIYEENGDCICVYGISDGELFKIDLSSSVSYSAVSTVNNGTSFNENGDIPATQRVISRWVKSYVDSTITEGAW